MKLLLTGPRWLECVCVFGGERGGLCVCVCVARGVMCMLVCVFSSLLTHQLARPCNVFYIYFPSMPVILSYFSFISMSILCTIVALTLSLSHEQKFKQHKSHWVERGKDRHPDSVLCCVVTQSSQRYWSWLVEPRNEKVDWMPRRPWMKWVQ